MSLIWFHSCNTVTRFCAGGIIRGFCTNVFLSVLLFRKNEGREFGEVGGN